MFVCTNPRYTPTADTFASVEEFQSMALACFGGRAALVCVGGRYYDETGALTLVSTLAAGTRVRVDAPGDDADGLLATVESAEGDYYYLKFDDGEGGSFRAREIEAV